MWDCFSWLFQLNKSAVLKKATDHILYLRNLTNKLKDDNKRMRGMLVKLGYEPDDVIITERRSTIENCGMYVVSCGDV